MAEPKFLLLSFFVFLFFFFTVTKSISVKRELFRLKLENETLRRAPFDIEDIGGEFILPGKKTRMT